MDFAVIPKKLITDAIKRAEDAGAPDIESACRIAAAELGIPCEAVLDVAMACTVQGAL